VSICAAEGCNNEYEKSTHNNIYCSPECCRTATNAKIMKRYYDNKKKRSGAVRHCACGARLSRYNMGDSCSACDAKKKSEVMDDIRRVFGESDGSD